MTAVRPHSQLKDLAAGTVLGPYVVAEKLATGGMGEVYRASHQVLGRPVAVKMLRPEYCANQQMVQRFFNEARAATAIQHSGIVEVYDFGYHEDGRAYLVMEFLEGQELGRLLEKRGRLSETEVAGITRAIATALAAAHAKGIIHRDLKPDNIFVLSDANSPLGLRIKVLDFGVAKLSDGLSTELKKTQTGALMGTPLYMAPEQARAAAAIDQRADLYSLGCMMYEMLVGVPPFTGEGAGEIIALQMFGEVDRPSIHLTELSSDLEAVVLKLLEKEPADRYQSASELVDVLSRTRSLANRVSGKVETPVVRKSLRLSAAGKRPSSSIVESSQPRLKEPVNTEVILPANDSKLGIIAAVVTCTLAAGTVAFFVLRNSGKSAASEGQSQNTVTQTTQAVDANSGDIGAQPETPPSTLPSTGSLAATLSPATATLRIDGVETPVSNGSINVTFDGAPHRIAVAAPGYETKSFTLTFAPSHPLQVSLARKGSKPAKEDSDNLPLLSPQGNASGSAGGTPTNGQNTAVKPAGNDIIVKPSNGTTTPPTGSATSPFERTLD